MWHHHEPSVSTETELKQHRSPTRFSTTNKLILEKVNICILKSNMHLKLSLYTLLNSLYVKRERQLYCEWKMYQWSVFVISHHAEPFKQLSFSLMSSCPPVFQLLHYNCLSWRDVQTIPWCVTSSPALFLLSLNILFYSYYGWCNITI